MLYLRIANVFHLLRSDPCRSWFFENKAELHFFSNNVILFLLSVRHIIAMMVVSTCSILSAVLSIYLSSKSAAVCVPKTVSIHAFNKLAKLIFLRKDVPDGSDYLESQKNATLEIVDKRPQASGKRQRLCNDQLEGYRWFLKRWRTSLRRNRRRILWSMYGNVSVKLLIDVWFGYVP